MENMHCSAGSVRAINKKSEMEILERERDRGEASTGKRQPEKEKILSLFEFGHGF